VSLIVLARYDVMLTFLRKSCAQNNPLIVDEGSLFKHFIPLLYDPCSPIYHFYFKKVPNTAIVAKPLSKFDGLGLPAWRHDGSSCSLHPKRRFQYSLRDSQPFASTIPSPCYRF
jgi:hypothetical protein